MTKCSENILYRSPFASLAGIRANSSTYDIEEIVLVDVGYIKPLFEICSQLYRKVSVFVEVAGKKTLPHKFNLATYQQRICQKG